jgi:hypothetical protein
VSRIFVVLGSVPYEGKFPIMAFRSLPEAQAFKAKLETRRKRYEARSERFALRMNELKHTMRFEEAYAAVGPSPREPKHNYPDYCVQEIELHA